MVFWTPLISVIWAKKVDIQNIMFLFAQTMENQHNGMQKHILSEWPLKGSSLSEFLQLKTLAVEFKNNSPEMHFF